MREQSPISSWLIPTIISGLVSIAAIGFSYEISKESLKLQKDTYKYQQETEERISKFRQSNIMLELVKAADGTEEKKLQVLLELVLQPLVEETEYDATIVKLSIFMESKAQFVDTPAKELLPTNAIVSVPKLSPADDKQHTKLYANLVKDFTTEQRLINSDKLVLAYPENKAEVMAALINGLLPDDNKWSYRVNIYIALTLGRLPNKWQGNTEQVKRVLELKSSKHYVNDKTFRRRVNEAVENHLEQ